MAHRAVRMLAVHHPRPGRVAAALSPKSKFRDAGSFWGPGSFLFCPGNHCQRLRQLLLEFMDWTVIHSQFVVKTCDKHEPSALQPHRGWLPCDVPEYTLRVRFGLPNTLSLGNIKMTRQPPKLARGPNTHNFA